MSKTYQCGSLSYSLRGLLVLFGWLLWGDFCFTLMESVVPSILPLRLKALGAPNWVMALILSTLPGMLNMTICPWVSFKSDRHRGRWGRRIPFILWTLPFICLCLVAMGWTEEIATLARAWLPGIGNVTPATLSIVLLGLFMVGFSFFNMFVGSVFWYLFNDVVPARFLGRFFGLFRVVGTLAGALYNAFVFKYAESHMREIFTGAALLYFVGFGVVCLRVKEGEYPPPPAAAKGSAWARLGAEIRSFCRESFTHRFYWLFYLMSAFAACSGAMGIFGVFFQKDMGMNLEQIGRMAAISSVVSMAAMYFAAIYVDRWHPLRITVYFTVFGTICTSYGGWIWLAVSPAPSMYYWMGIAASVVTVFGSALSGDASIPLFMRLMPPSRYGQICSANALVRSTATVLGGLAAGMAMDGMMKLCHGANYAYRFIFVWNALLSIGTLISTALLYRAWKRLGGDEGYSAPAPWNPGGREDMSEGHIAVPPRPRWLGVALNLFTVSFGLQAVLVLVFLVLLHGRGLGRALWWNAWVYLPAAGVLLGAWLWLGRSIQQDVRRQAAGGAPISGIPHHGVLMVVAIQGIFLVALNWAWLGWSMHVNQERDIIWFGLAALVALGSNLPAVHVLRLIEHGSLPWPPAPAPAASAAT